MDNTLIDLFHLFNPSKRLYWLFLGSSFLLAAFYFKSFTRAISKIFKKEYWINSSTILDYKLFVFNYFFKLIFVGAESWLIYNMARKMTYFGLSFNVKFLDSLSSLAIVVVYTFFIFVVDDLARFYQHFMMHKISWLWRFHKVHHSATVLTPITLYRTHFIEIIIAFLRRILTMSFVTSFFLSFGSGMVSGYTVLGVNLFGFIFNVFGANLRHMPIPLSFGFFEKIFISPAQHQIHHSSDPKHYDKNFGIAFSVWDQIHGSWLKGSGKQELKFGLSKKEINHQNNLFSVLWGPFKN